MRTTNPKIDSGVVDTSNAPHYANQKTGLKF